MKACSVTAVVAALFVALSSAQAQALKAAGDLDGDGRLDFVVESARDDGGTSVELWLSSGPAARYSECRAGC
jgi:hypothetical protein